MAAADTELVGFVGAKRSWPWVPPASQPLDAEWNKQPVYQFEWAQMTKSRFCLDQRTWDASVNLGRVTLSSCVPDTKDPYFQFFVGTPQRNLIAVWATNVEYVEGNALKVAITTQATNNANYLYLEQLGNGDDAWCWVAKP